MQQQQQQSTQSHNYLLQQQQQTTILIPQNFINELTTSFSENPNTGILTGNTGLLHQNNYQHQIGHHQQQQQPPVHIQLIPNVHNDLHLNHFENDDPANASNVREYNIFG